ncbi:hypothetical protein C5S39_14505 [Candidatus Methanophagaceae archaeon]|jgi:hypothetical protein|nr:hypothetical protein C5S39_14505 [Methanophagales archaeon]
MGEENYPELMRKYHERWIAIVSKRVVGVGRSMSEAEKEAHTKTGVAKIYKPLFDRCNKK